MRCIDMCENSKLSSEELNIIIIRLFMLVHGTVMSLETSNKMKALVLGHSFIKRLRRWMRSNGRSMSTMGSVFCRRKSWGLSRRAYDHKKQKINKFLSKEFGRNTSTETEFTSTKMETGASIIALKKLFGLVLAIE
jgi:hypothetical protein